MTDILKTYRDVDWATKLVAISQKLSNSWMCLCILLVYLYVCPNSFYIYFFCSLNILLSIYFMLSGFLIVITVTISI